MYHIIETINYIWYLLGYSNNIQEIENNNICEINKEKKINWKQLIEKIKKDEETNDFPLHHKKIKEAIKKKIKTKQNKWKQFLIENKKKLS